MLHDAALAGDITLVRQLIIRNVAMNALASSTVCLLLLMYHSIAMKV
jgi:hypothetical protein